MKAQRAARGRNLRHETAPPGMSAATPLPEPVPGRRMRTHCSDCPPRRTTSSTLRLPADSGSDETTLRCSGWLPTSVHSVRPSGATIESSLTGIGAESRLAQRVHVGERGRSRCRGRRDRRGPPPRGRCALRTAPCAAAPPDRVLPGPAARPDRSAKCSALPPAVPPGPRRCRSLRATCVSATPKPHIHNCQCRLNERR